MARAKSKYSVTLRNDGSSLIEADNVITTEGDGVLRFYVAAECVAAFAPGGWISYVKQEMPNG